MEGAPEIQASMMKQPTIENMKRIGDKLNKDKIYFIPKTISVKDKYLLHELITKNAPCYIPLRPTSQELFAAGYKPKENYTYDPKGRKVWRRYASWRSQAILDYLGELCYQQNKKMLWCESITVDLDYLLIILSTLDYDLYVKLKNTELRTVSMINIPGQISRNKASKEIDGLENLINNLMFELVACNKAKRRTKDAVQRICSQVEAAVDGYINKDTSQQYYKSEFSRWSQYVKDVKKMDSFDISSEYFSKIFTANKFEFSENGETEVLLFPEPLTKQELATSTVTRAIKIIDALISQDEKGKSLPTMPHPKSFKDQIESVSKIKDPVDLAAMKETINNYSHKGSKLPEELVYKMLETYWNYDSSTVQLIPYTVSNLEIPTIRTSLLPYAFIRKQATIQQQNKFKSIQSIFDVSMNAHKYNIPSLSDNLFIDDLNLMLSKLTVERIGGALIANIDRVESSLGMMLLSSQEIEYNLSCNISQVYKKECIDGYPATQSLKARRIEIINKHRISFALSNIARKQYYLMISHFRVVQMKIMLSLLDRTYSEDSKVLLRKTRIDYAKLNKYIFSIPAVDVQRVWVSFHTTIIAQIDYFGKSKATNSNDDDSVEENRTFNSGNVYNKSQENKDDNEVIFSDISDLDISDDMTKKHENLSNTIGLLDNEPSIEERFGAKKAQAIKEVLLKDKDKYKDDRDMRVAVPNLVAKFEMVKYCLVDVFVEGIKNIVKTVDNNKDLSYESFLKYLIIGYEAEKHVSQLMLEYFSKNIYSIISLKWIFRISGLVCLDANKLVRAVYDLNYIFGDPRPAIMYPSVVTNVMMGLSLLIEALESRTKQGTINLKKFYPIEEVDYPYLTFIEAAEKIEDLSKNAVKSRAYDEGNAVKFKNDLIEIDNLMPMGSRKLADIDVKHHMVADHKTRRLRVSKYEGITSNISKDGFYLIDEEE